MEAVKQKASIAIDNTVLDDKGSHGREAAKDIVFGSIAGIVGKYIEYPFDTVKVRLQSQSDKNPLYSGPVDCFKQSIRQNGFLGLYRGISAPLVGAAMETSSLFFSYRVAQNAMQKLYFTEKTPLPMTALIACGGASGAFTSLLLTPIELVKCKMQVPLVEGRIGQGPLSLIATIYRGEGFWGFWHGQLGTLIRETGGSAAWFGSYEAVTAMFRSLSKKSIDENSLPLWQQMTAGAAAGVGYNFIFYPADTIKSRMQTEDIKLGTTKKKFWAVGKLLWKQQGIKGFYRGCGVTVGRAAPSSAFIFAIYEALQSWWE